jgi:hypothetical protein
MYTPKSKNNLIRKNLTQNRKEEINLKKLRETKKTRRTGGRKWSAKYKNSINCKSPRGFSQRQYCKYGRK